MGETINTQTVVDISLDIQTKRKYRINGDDNLIIELNPGDLGIITRYQQSIPKMNSLMDEVENINFSEEVNPDDPAIEQFKSADSKMRDIINELFDYDVCKVCADGGSMFDMCNGKLRFEEITEQLFGLYDKTIVAEYKKVQKRIQKHTDKYLPQDHRKKS